MLAFATRRRQDSRKNARGIGPLHFYGSPPMVGERSPKPSMWVRFLPSVLLHDIASNSTLTPVRAELRCGKWFSTDNKNLLEYDVCRKHQRIVQRTGSQSKLADPQGVGTEFSDSIDRFHNTGADRLVYGLVLRVYHDFCLRPLLIRNS